MTPLDSASKLGRALNEVASEGAKVFVHAALIDKKVKVQYLASSVWLTANYEFNSSNTPKLIVRDEVHGDKIDIYRYGKSSYML